MKYKQALKDNSNEISESDRYIFNCNRTFNKHLKNKLFNCLKDTFMTPESSLWELRMKI
jgi:hypothetical protein